MYITHAFTQKLELLSTHLRTPWHAITDYIQKFIEEAFRQI